VLQQIEGSQAVAKAIALARPEVISAYPISPQTHIVETLSKLVKEGELGSCQYLNVESEFSAMSACIGASAAGARSYTATASQGLLFMVEAVYNASGLGLPIVMTVANRAIGAPINIWNDHSDSMSQRDSGWIQLYAEDNQEALDLHIQAFRLAEEVSLPVMVCMDGFILTHAVEEVELPSQEQVDEFLPPFEPRQVLDPEHPVSIGAMVGPEAFTEVRYLAHARQLQALDEIPRIAEEYARITGRHTGGLIEEYLVADADTVVVALGSVIGTLKDAVDQMRADGHQVGVLGLKSFRPFPIQAVRDAIGSASRVIVLEKALAVGIGGIVSADIRTALADLPITTNTVIAGLGGRSILIKSLIEMIKATERGELEELTFLDLNTDLVEKELERARTTRKSGPTAENLLMDVGVMGDLHRRGSVQ
jgi:pyruvate ferredoxin oxidoreductase alpha subunit